jgi:long-chain acyl-CoA synthetase
MGFGRAAPGSGMTDASAVPLASFAATVRWWARTQPDAPALTVVAAGTPDETWTYADLDRMSSRVANGLAGLGVTSGDRVAHIGRNRIGYPALLYGASKARAALVGLNWRLTANELSPLLADSRPRVIVADAEFAPAIDAALAAAGVGATVVPGDDLDGWVSTADRDERSDPEADDVALIFYTSGTTGVPKGACITVEAIANNLRRPAPWNMRPHRAVLICSPMFHTAGTGWVYLSGYHGAHALVLRDPAPSTILNALAEHRVAQALLVPTVIQMMLDDPALPATDLSALETLVYGASPISPSVLARAIDAFGCHFVQAYGMTETGGPITYLLPEDHDPSDTDGRLRSAGRPPDGIEVRVVDPDSRRDCAPYEFGEVWTKSDQMMTGYLDRPEATASTITGDGWLRTGDGGYLDRDGYLFLTDRLSDVIVTGAENVYPLEVERVLGDHPSVAEAAVVGVPHERWGETAHAVVVPAWGEHVEPAELIAWCRQRLAHFKAPTAVTLIDALPKNPAGKVLRRVVREGLEKLP